MRGVRRSARLEHPSSVSAQERRSTFSHKGRRGRSARLCPPNPLIRLPTADCRLPFFPLPLQPSYIAMAACRWERDVRPDISGKCGADEGTRTVAGRVSLCPIWSRPQGRPDEGRGQTPAAHGGASYLYKSGAKPCVASHSPAVSRRGNACACQGEGWELANRNGPSNTAPSGASRHPPAAQGRISGDVARPGSSPVYGGSEGRARPVARPTARSAAGGGLGRSGGWRWQHPSLLPLWEKVSPSP